MANNYLDDLLGKISAYDLFNVLIPGALVTYSVSQMPLGSCIDCSNWLALFVMSYVLGLIASRIGSLCIEPLVRKLKPTGKRDYWDLGRFSGPCPGATPHGPSPRDTP